MTRKAAFNNLGLTLGTNLKFYTSAAKELKLKVKRFWWLIPTFVEVTGEKLVGHFTPHPILNMVKHKLGICRVTILPNPKSKKCDTDTVAYKAV